MPPVFPQMGDDALSARQLGKNRRGNRVRFDAFSRLPDGRNMINVHGQPWHAELPPRGEKECFDFIISLSKYPDNLSRQTISRKARQEKQPIIWF
jgi:hypothetical protein